jgi:eukaryotic-like serine/threonine-protein kinase
VQVPSVIFKSFDEAADILREAGLKPQKRSGFPFGDGGNRVLGQDPSPGSKVDRGTTVTLNTF